MTAPAADGADPVLARREPEIKLRRRRSGNLARLFERKVIRSATCALFALAVVLGTAPQPPALATSRSRFPPRFAGESVISLKT